MTYALLAPEMILAALGVLVLIIGLISPGEAIR